MSILIKGMKMPESCFECVRTHKFFSIFQCASLPDFEFESDGKFPHLEDRSEFCPLIELPDHGDLIDRDALSDAMYHEAFETDSDLQKWDSGCWIRYKMFERQRNSAPVVIPAERRD